MTQIRTCLAIFGIVLVLPAAHAQVNADAARALAEKRMCLACHKPEEKSMGPSMRDMAKKYQGVAGAQAVIMTRMRNGSKGIWGNTAMAPVSKEVSEEDLKAMVAWMLAPSSR